MSLQYQTIVLSLLILTVSCHRSSSIIMSNGKDYIEIKYAGAITMNEDETAIQSISPRGFLRYRNNNEKMLAEPDGHEGIRYELYNDGKRLDPEMEEGKKFLTRAVKEMIELGFDAQGRMERIYRRGGYKALLGATNSLKSDYLKGLYFERLLQSDSIAVPEMVDIIQKVRLQVGSDYDKARLLSTFGDKALGNDSTSRAYLDAIASIHSDYDKSTSLKRWLRVPLPVDRYQATLGVIGTLGSDFEKSNTLKTMIRQGVYEGAPFDSLMSVIGQVSGDYDRSNLLREVVHKDLKEEGSWVALIHATEHITGDYDKSNLLVEIARRLPRTDSLKAAYLATAKTLHSDMDYGKVVRAVE